jgi:inorganic pyrophosphatase
MRHRAAVFVLDTNKVLLFHRFKNGDEYYAVPGGGVETDETPEIAAVRELKEETSLNVVLGEKIGELEEDGNRQYFYIARSWSGTPALGGPEAERNSPDNHYLLEWISIEKLKDINLRTDIAALLLKYAKAAHTDIFSRIKTLDLPFGEYVVVSSGTLEALGIRTAQDLDIAVTPTLFKKLRAAGRWTEEERYGKLFLSKPSIDIIRQLSWDAYPTTNEEAIASALIIDGIPFMNLYELKQFKQALGREKDLADIKRIEAYEKNTALRFLQKTVTANIDRPLGSKHQKWNFEYPINYGFIPNTKSGDGEEIDAYVLGVDEPLKEFVGKCIAIIHRLDEDDDKLVLAPDSIDFADEEIRVATKFQEKFFKSVIVR